MRETLKEYLNHTLFIRKSSKVSQLFLYYGSKSRGQPASKCRISEWLKLVIKDAYACHGLPSPKCQGHDSRRQSTSWAAEAGVDPQRICDAATWSSSSAFVRHYKLRVQSQARSEFGHSVLKRAATSMGRSLRHPASSVLSQPSRGTIPKVYKIPRISRP